MPYISSTLSKQQLKTQERKGRLVCYPKVPIVLWSASVLFNSKIGLIINVYFKQKQKNAYAKYQRRQRKYRKSSIKNIKRFKKKNSNKSFWLAVKRVESEDMLLSRISSVQWGEWPMELHVKAKWTQDLKRKLGLQWTGKGVGTGRGWWWSKTFLLSFLSSE